MANVSKYRQGYEDMQRELAENEAAKASLPELFVKGVVQLPVKGVQDFLRNGDEDRGRDDALHGRSFDPFKHEREEKLREQEEAEAQKRRGGNTPKGEHGPGLTSEVLSLASEGSDPVFTLIKLGFAIAAFAISLMIMFASLPFWLGGMVVGWLSGFCLGVFRAHRLGAAGLQEASVHEGTKSGRYLVGEDFLNEQKCKPGTLALPVLACAVWCLLLVRPLMEVVDEVRWVGGAAVLATLVAVVLGGMWGRKGFRRSLAWSARCAHGLPGGADAGWGSAGAGLCCVLLVFLALMGKGLPMSLVHDFGNSRSNQHQQSLIKR